MANGEMEGKEKMNAGAKPREDLPLRISIGYAAAAAQEICGDTAISCGLPDGSLALILSDGMGRGIRAAADSRRLARRMRKNLKDGMRPAAAIKEANRFMLKSARGGSTQRMQETSEQESFATLDLLIIDRNDGKAKFYKMGAATSFLIRNGEVREFERAALPIGIIPGLRTGQIAYRLREGDTLVMVSDGIIEADSRDPAGRWLPELLGELFSSEESKHSAAALSARQLAAAIMREAASHCRTAEGDDRTVAVVKIMPKPRKKPS